jgi:hypothetical protein
MQSPVQNEVVAASSEDQLLAAALKELEALGFLRFKQNLRLLKKTDGDLAAVREYLLAKKKFRDAVVQQKKEAKKHRICPCKLRKEKKESDSSDKAAKKAEKKELRALWKAGRKEMKKSRKEWKKSVKKEGGEEQESERKLAKRPCDPSVEARTLSSLSVWPQQVTRLYLDGNNMLYVAAPLRQMSIHRKWDSAEVALSSVAFEFTKKLLPAAVKTTVVFDNATRSVLQSYIADNFQILSARPAFATSDDALVQWVQENACASSPVISMVVTSDTELQRRLAAVSGVILVKPKVWMEHAASMLEKEKQNNSNNNDNNSSAASTKLADAPVNLDSWMASWVQKMEVESLTGHFETSLSVADQANK